MDMQATQLMDNESLQVFNTPVPPSELKFDENQFKLFLTNSISLTFEEKIQIIQNIPALKQAQLDEIMKILEVEYKQYQSLVADHTSTMKAIEEERLHAEEELEAEMREHLKTEDDQRKLDALRKAIEAGM